MDEQRRARGPSEIYRSNFGEMEKFVPLLWSECTRSFYVILLLMYGNGAGNLCRVTWIVSVFNESPGVSGTGGQHTPPFQTCFLIPRPGVSPGPFRLPRPAEGAAAGACHATGIPRNTPSARGRLTWIAIRFRELYWMSDAGVIPVPLCEMHAAHADGDSHSPVPFARLRRRRRTTKRRPTSDEAFTCGARISSISRRL